MHIILTFLATGAGAAWMMADKPYLQSTLEPLILVCCPLAYLLLACGPRECVKNLAVLFDKSTPAEAAERAATVFSVLERAMWLTAVAASLLEFAPVLNRPGNYSVEEFWLYLAYSANYPLYAVLIDLAILLPVRIRLKLRMRQTAAVQGQSS